MCASNNASTVAKLDSHADAALAAVEELTKMGATGDVTDETAQRLLLAGVRLFAHKIDSENRTFRPVPESAGINATCSIPDDHIDPRRSAFFMARSVLRDIQEYAQC